MAAFPLVHSVNGFRLHQSAVYLERQTQFGDIPWPLKGSAGVFLDSAQPLAHGVRVASKGTVTLVIVGALEGSVG